MVAKYVDDESLPWPERYARLEAHHIAETTELVAKLRAVRAELAGIKIKTALDTEEAISDYMADQLEIALFHRPSARRTSVV